MLDPLFLFKYKNHVPLPIGVTYFVLQYEKAQDRATNHRETTALFSYMKLYALAYTPHAHTVRQKNI